MPPAPFGSEVWADMVDEARSKIRVLNHATAAINGSLASNEVIDNAVGSLLAATGLTSGVIYWLDRERDLLVGRGAKGFRQGLQPGIDVHARSSRSLPSRALRASQPVLFDAGDDRAGYDGVTERERRCIVPEGIRNAAFVKIGTGASAHGVLALCAHGSAWRLDDEWLELFSMVAGQIAIALERVQSHEAVTERGAELASLYEVGRRLDGLDAEAALPEALDFACRTFGFERCAVEGPVTSGAGGGAAPSTAHNRVVVPLVVGNHHLGQMLIDCAAEPGIRERRLGRALAELLSVAAWRQHRYQVSRKAGAAEQQGLLAREIHDGLAQRFYAIQLNLTAAAGSVDEPASYRHYLDQAMRNSQLGMEEARRWVRSLRQPPAVQRRLGEALAEIADEFIANFGVACDVDVHGPEATLDGPTHQAVTRGVQELLHNVGKHAEAANARVSVRFDSAHVEVTVADDGRGLDGADDSGRAGFGLLGVRERMAEIGASFSICGEPGHGTTAVFGVPLLCPVPPLAADGECC